MNKIIFFIYLIFSGVFVYGQRSGDICIADSMTDAHESAMLHIISTNKGLLLPTVTIEERNNIKPLTIGLTVYVNDNTNGGFQYWNGQAWTSLEVINPAKIATIAPLGGIILYHGKFENFDANGKGIIGTEMEGWQLCNGKNGAPDLSSRFVVSGGRDSEVTFDDKYKTIGEGRTIANTFTIKKENIPPHTHDVDKSVTISHNHKHNVTSENYYSLTGTEMDAKNSHIHPYNTKSSGPREKGGEFSRKNSECGIFGGKGCDVATNNLSAEIDLNTFSVSEASPHINFTIDSKVVNENDGEILTFDNRPRYYVLAFIIRVDDNIGEGGYDGKYKIVY